MNQQKEKEALEDPITNSRLTEKAAELRSKSKETTRKLEELKKQSDALLHPEPRESL